MINNLLLSVVLGIVFLGTLYPLFVEAVSGEKLSVGAPYFNAVAGPLALILAMLVGIGPLLAWRRERRPCFKQLTMPALLGATALAISLILAPDMAFFRALALPLRAYLAAASILPLIARNPFRAPLATWGMVVAHFGIAVALARNGRQCRLHQRAARDRQARRDAHRRSVAGPARGCHPDRRQELDGDGSGAPRDARPGRSR